MSRFIALLSTDRPLERAVQFFADSRAGAESQALSWLQRNGQPGDRFNFTELREVAAGSITMSGRVNGAVVLAVPEVLESTPKLLHGFVRGSGIFCDLCGLVEERH